ncbi:NADH dehydrogenase [ubiquinone] iron-sulfur protein 4, mitochondrial [Microplitis demolitor]|uniref:NADH dehydrogenase [ubiquinone] iron-sulfur protein 4, mitochondrial n=1 Tax=Microplitis demolitor TaxID=69319 RepID=UPI0004CD98E9|nr:NADH dehydrogenase [ubiquinone] iron-sulfur protein 4, mitochondrial [Microplitis demolitor]
MAASVILRYGLHVEKMNSGLLIKNCITKLSGTECTRALSLSSTKLDKAKQPVPVPKDVHNLLTSPEAEELRRADRRQLITVDEPDDISIVSGVPEEHIKTRTVRIYQPAKNAMQSGTNNINFWQIDFDNRERWENNLMGWSSTGDPMSNVKVDFASVDEAIDHCKKMKWNYFIQKPNVDDPKPRSYGANFSWDKRTRVTTK